MRAPPPRLAQLLLYPATVGTALLAIAVTIASWSKIDVSILVENPQLAHGQLWRLLTSALPHSDPFHIAFNLLWLWRLGRWIEDRFGAPRTFALYALLAVTSSAAEYAFLTGGVGLSGVVYGLWGLLWMMDRLGDTRFRGAVDRPTNIAFIAWFFICIALSVTNVLPTANIAHGVGATMGAAIGYAIAANAKNRRRATAALAAVTLSLLLAATIARPWLNLAPGRGHEQAYLGYVALKADRPREARWWYHDAVIMNPADAVAWFSLGIARANLNDFDGALAAYNTAATLAPTNALYASTRNTMRDYCDLLHARTASTD